MMPFGADIHGQNDLIWLYVTAVFSGYFADTHFTSKISSKSIVDIIFFSFFSFLFCSFLLFNANACLLKITFTCRNSVFFCYFYFSKQSE